MVCQNQSIDDSDAPLARDLRVLVRERLQAGDSDRQVIDFLVSRYGEFVLLKPRFSLHTALLWLGPLAVLLIGAFGIFVFARRHRPAGDSASSAPAALTPAEEARLSEILGRPDR
jgi:cytochrome c-type biogenesis protein CcmH